MKKVSDRMREIYEQTAARYDSVTNRARMPHFAVMAELMKLKGTESVIDFGCGPGNFARAILPYVKRVTGVDASPAMIDQAKKTMPGQQWQVGNATATGFPGAHFDAAISSQLLPWLPDPNAFFAEVARVLKPGAPFGLITSASSTYREFFQALEKLLRVYEEYYQTDSVSQVWGSHTYTHSQVQAMLAKHGFETDQWMMLQTEVPTSVDDYLDLMRMFTGDHYLYPIPEQFRDKARAQLSEFLFRDGLTLNERSLLVAARKT